MDCTHPDVIEQSEEQQLRQILLRIYRILPFGYGLIMLSTFLSKDWEVLFLVPALGAATYVCYRLARSGRLQCSVTILLSAIVFVLAILGTNGQGVHDISIMTFSCVMVLGSLTLKIRNQLLIGIFSMLVVCWLVLGEMIGWYQPEPSLPGRPSDLVIILVVLALCVVISFLLFEKLRRALEIAELEGRKRLKVANELTREANLKTKLGAMVHDQVQDSLSTLRGLMVLEDEELAVSINAKVVVIERLHKFSKGARTNVHDYFEDMRQERSDLEIEIPQWATLKLDRMLALALYAEEFVQKNNDNKKRVSLAEDGREWCCLLQSDKLVSPDSTLSEIMIRQLGAELQETEGEIEVRFPFLNNKVG